MYSRLFASVAAALVVSSASGAVTEQASNALAHDIFKELIEINTTESVGSVTAASEAMAKRLAEAGFPASDVQVLGPNDRKKNLVVRLRGSGKHKPILLIGHLDVVEARREDWTTDPFRFVEKDGRFYGRGTQDMKNGDAIMMATLIRLKKEGYRPSRDIILGLTADEESGDSNGVEWLLKNHRELVDAQFVINHDGNSITSDHGKALYFEMDGTEKVYADYLLTATNPGGHSSLPVPDNAIYHITAALDRLSRYEFPFELNSVTRAYYERMSTIETGQRAADMKAILQTPPASQAVERLSHDAIDHSTMRTTCVATRLEGGHANNALPQRATANVNCRIFPGTTIEQVRAKLQELANDPQIKITAQAARSEPSKAPPLTDAIMKPILALAAKRWPGVPVIPMLDIGATDASFMTPAGIPTYGFTAMFFEPDGSRLHGLNERIRVNVLYEGRDFLTDLVKAYAK